MKPVRRTPRRPQPRSHCACARGRRQQRTAAAAHASAGQRRRVGGRAAVRSVPLVTTAPVRGVGGVPVAPRGWEHVELGAVGGRLPRAHPVGPPPVRAFGCGGEGGAAMTPGFRGARTLV